MSLVTSQFVRMDYASHMTAVVEVMAVHVAVGAMTGFVSG
jgi:hypothetical protein